MNVYAKNKNLLANFLQQLRQFTEKIEWKLVVIFIFEHLTCIEYLLSVSKNEEFFFAYV